MLDFSFLYQLKRQHQPQKFLKREGGRRRTLILVSIFFLLLNYSADSCFIHRLILMRRYLFKCDPSRGNKFICSTRWWPREPFKVLRECFCKKENRDCRGKRESHQCSQNVRANKPFLQSCSTTILSIQRLHHGKQQKHVVITSHNGMWNSYLFFLLLRVSFNSICRQGLLRSI